MCDQVPIVSCLSLVWSPALPGFLSPPPCRLASAGALEGKPIGLHEPHFPHWGWVVQAGGGSRTPPRSGAPSAPREEFSEGPFSRSTKSFGVKAQIHLSLFLAGSTPRFYDHALSSSSRGLMPTGSWQATLWPGIELCSLPSHSLHSATAHHQVEDIRLWCCLI